MLDKKIYSKTIICQDEKSILTCLEDIIERYPVNTAITESSTAARVSYSQLSNEILRYANYFLDKGIRKNCKVILQIPNSKEFLFAMFALIKINAIPINANSALRENELEGIVKHTSAVAYIYKEEYMGYCYVPMASRLKERVITDPICPKTTGGKCPVVAENCVRRRDVSPRLINLPYILALIYTYCYCLCINCAQVTA